MIQDIKSKLILALDFHDPAVALEWVDKTKQWIGIFKVGSQLFTQTGPPLVREIINKGAKVFLDLKFHDIPNTVAAAGEAAVDMGVSIFNVHASGGLAMMKACAAATVQRAKEKNIPRPLILAVTVLTSLDDAALKSEIGYARPVADQILQFAKLAKEAGLDGVVASPREIALLRKIHPPPFKILTPGIRCPDDPPDDQKRTLTAPEALALGADYLVLGRTITGKCDPVEKLRFLYSNLR